MKVLERHTYADSYGFLYRVGTIRKGMVTYIDERGSLVRRRLADVEAELDRSGGFEVERH